MASGARLIFDAYNANAGGMIAAFNAFSSEPAESRIAVLGSMAELGIRIGCRLRVLQAGSPCLLLIDGSRLSVRPDWAMQILVRPLSLPT